MDLLIFLIIIVFLIAIQMAVPFLVKRTTVFGVTIPDEFVRDSKLTSYKKRYSFFIFIIGLMAVSLFLLWPLENSNEELRVLLGTAILFSLLFINTALYFYFHAKTVQHKRGMKWGEDLKQVKMTDLSVRLHDTMLPSTLFLLPIIITLGVISYTALNYNLLPEQIPIHWGVDGKPDSFTAKTYASAHSMSLVLLVMQLMFFGINKTTKRSGIKLSATRLEESRIRQLTLRKYSSWFLLITSILITMLLSFLQLQMIHPNLVNDAVLIVIPLIFIFIILIGTVIFAVKVGRAGTKIESPSKSGISDLDEDQFWKGGIIYFNKNDPSIFVEKRFGVGWTINLANPIGYLIIICPLIVILLISFLG